MGKSSNPQPTHLSLRSDSVDLVPSSSTSPCPIRPCASVAPPTKPACPAAVNAASSTQPPSPSPLTSSLSSTPVATCFDAWLEPAPSSPMSPVDDEVFYDALDDLPGLDEPHPHKPVRTNVLQVLPEPAFDGAAKGRMGVAPSRNSARPTTYHTSATPTYYVPPVRGSSKPAASPSVTHPSVAPLALQAQLNSARLWVPDYAPRREPVKKALLVGINYPDMGKDKRLWYAVGDATRFGQSLKTLGFHPGNIRLITDESGYEVPTFSTLMRSIDWLVAGARDGDVLFFVFSGHCVKDQGLLTADKRFISREVLHQHLVLRVPAGCELQIVFDCCSAAALIQLQYCVGRMASPAQELAPSEQSTEQSAVCESGSDPPATSELAGSTQPRTASHLEPFQGSFHGLPAVAPPTPAPAPITPAMADLDTFAPAPSSAATHRHPRGGVVAAPPVASPTPVATALGAVAGQATGIMSSWFGRGQTSAGSSATPAVPPRTSTSTPVPQRASTSGDPRRGRQVVVEGNRTPDHFEERKGPYVQPAGKVMVWAGAGEEQQAFEAYGGVKHGIVTNAMCSALDACASNMLTRRDLWRYLVGAIDKENAHRSERDARKNLSERQDPRLRVQHAELWISQAEPLSSAAPVLDRPMLRI